MHTVINKKSIKAGLIAGSLDITAACIQYYIKTGKGPAGVLKFVASGLFGKAAFTDGMIMPLAGLCFHFVVAFCFTFFFFWLTNKFPALLKTKVLTGICYGIFIWAVMNKIVLPLSNTPPVPFKIMNAIIAASILIVCIGIPLAFLKPDEKQTKKI
jgi:hypothetical protein